MHLIFSRLWVLFWFLENKGEMLPGAFLIKEEKKTVKTCSQVIYLSVVYDQWGVPDN